MFKNPANQLRLAAYLQLFKTLGFIHQKGGACRNSEPSTVPFGYCSKSPLKDWVFWVSFLSPLLFMALTKQGVIPEAVTWTWIRPSGWSSKSNPSALQVLQTVPEACWNTHPEDASCCADWLGWEAPFQTKVRLVPNGIPGSLKINGWFGSCFRSISSYPYI